MTLGNILKDSLVLSQRKKLSAFTGVHPDPQRANGLQSPAIKAIPGLSVIGGMEQLAVATGEQIQF